MTGSTTGEKMTKEMSNFDRYLKTWNGKILLDKYNLTAVGVWHIFGEDPNCDMGGPHHTPDLGYFEGKLEDVIHVAVELPQFWQWGGGGQIKREDPPKVRKVHEHKRKLVELRELREERKAIDERIKKLEAVCNAG